MRLAVELILSASLGLCAVMAVRAADVPIVSWAGAAILLACFANFTGGQIVRALHISDKEAT
jgi:hypothetical protein